ncbi:hypothetical protein SY88_03490 [Clostridiales bacterium PH28_bin88]|nr:hypothetical protein SY88_03490 [Clostridiales bacterium PH28_bin88]
MAGISEPVKKLLTHQPCFVATADNSGKPYMDIQHSPQVLNEATILFAGSGGTYDNVLQNPYVTLAVTDPQGQEGYRLVGRAELLQAGDLYEQVINRTQREGTATPEAVIQVFVDSVQPMSAFS